MDLIVVCVGHDHVSFFVLNTWYNLDLADHGNPNNGTVRSIVLFLYELD